MSVDYRNLRRIDLNLTVALHALVEEGSVSKAAQRLNLGQPAMSHQLRRLRELFDDDILVRQGAAMVPTPRARALAGRISEGLNLLDAAVQDVREFDPARDARDFRIAMPDSIEVILGTRLLNRIHHEAPQCRLRISEFNRTKILERLDTNELDLGIGVIGRVRSWHRTQALYQGGYIGLTATPFETRDPDLAAYAARPHLLVSAVDDFAGRVDRFLKKAGVRRRVVLSTTRFHAIPFYLRATDAVALLPTAVGLEVAKRFDLHVFALPLDVPKYSVRMVWHQRSDEIGSHRWIRGAIREIVENDAEVPFVDDPP